MKKINLIEKIYIILLFTYNILLFCSVNNYTSTFWIAYTVTTIFLLIGMLLIRTFGLKIKNTIVQINLIMLTSTMSIIQFIMNIVLIFMGLPLKYAIILEIVLIVFYILGIVLFASTGKYFDEQDKRQKEGILFIGLLKNNVKLLINNSKDDEVKNELGLLLEELSYLDPVSNDALKLVEQGIIERVNDINNNIIKEDSLEIIKEINKDLLDYKDKLKLLK